MISGMRRLAQVRRVPSECHAVTLLATGGMLAGVELAVGLELTLIQDRKSALSAGVPLVQAFFNSCNRVREPPKPAFFRAAPTVMVPAKTAL